MNTIIALLMFLAGSQALAWGQCQIHGTPENLAKPASNSVLSPCHRQIQNSLTAQASGFRTCREKFGNTGEPLHLTAEINMNIVLKADFDKKKTAVAVTELSRCFVNQIEKVKLDDKLCECSYTLVWDGSFPLSSAKTKSTSTSASDGGR